MTLHNIHRAGFVGGRVSRAASRAVAVFVATVFLLSCSFGWTADERPFPAQGDAGSLSLSVVATSGLSPEPRTQAYGFMGTWAAESIRRLIEKEGMPGSLDDLQTWADAVVHGYSNVHIVPEFDGRGEKAGIVIEIPDENVALRYFDPARANFITPYTDVESLRTDRAGSLNRQMIRRTRVIQPEAMFTPGPLSIANFPADYLNKNARFRHKATIDDPVRVVLIMPRSPLQKAKPTRMPHGIMGLASCLRDRDFLLKLSREIPELGMGSISDIPYFDVRILDLQAEEKDFDLEKSLREIDPDVVGVSAVSSLFNSAKKVADVAAKAAPSSVRVIGGVHVSALSMRKPAELERELAYSRFNMAVIREGEEALCEALLSILSGRDLRSVPQVAVKWDDGISRSVYGVRDYRGAKRRFALRDYPLPSRSLDLMKMDGYDTLVNVRGENRGVAGAIMTSRGCPFGCKFCASKSVFSKNVEHLTAEQVFEEMKDFYAKGSRGFYIMDDNYCLDPSKISRLAGMIKESGLDIGYSAFAHANSITDEVSAALKASCCEVICLGVESGDEALLKGIGKGTSVGRIKEATRLLQSHGIHVRYFLMVGLPGQDWASISKTAELLSEAKPDSIDIAVAMPYPGSAYYDSNEIMFSEGMTEDMLVHNPEPQLKLKSRTDVVTYTGAMTSEEIARSRELLTELFGHLGDKARVSAVMDEINGRMARAPSTMPARRSDSDSAKELVGYLDRNAPMLAGILGEGKPDTLLRVPVEAVETAGIENVRSLLESFQGAPNGYVELYAMSGVGEVTADVYGRYGLRRKALPDSIGLVSKRSNKNTITLFPAFKGESVDRGKISSRLGGMEMTPEKSILSPIGLQHDPAGLARATVFGLRMMGIARKMNTPASRLKLTNPDEYRELQSDMQAALEAYKNVCDPGEKFHFSSEDLDDVAGLIAGEINSVVRALNKLIKLLPSITRIDASELRHIYERACAVVMSA